MKQYKKYYSNINILLIIMFTFSSCEEIIDVELRDAEPKIVIEANLSDIPNAQQIVKVTRTVPFKSDSAIENVKGAIVFITERESNTQYSYTELTPGVYAPSQLFIAQQEKSYTLTVSIDGITYESTAKTPKKVFLDSVSITKITLLDETRQYVKTHYQDMAGEANYYRYIVKWNDIPYKEFFVENDRFTEGRYVNNVIYTGDPKIEKGDKIDVEFQNITPEIYRYFFAITQISGGGGPPVAGGNPESNISNGALGYFSVHTSQLLPSKFGE